MDITFDIETTGLPPKGVDWETAYNDFPHIVRLSWIVGGEENDYLIKPNGYEISAEMAAIHGTTNEQALKDGHDLILVLKSFLFDAQNCETNLLRNNFDKERFNEILHKDKRYDTMMKAMPVMGVSKWPKLYELYQFLFNKSFDNQHNALADIRVTLECYAELKKRTGNV